MHGGAYITYRELNQSSNRLAHLLREKGIQPDTIVGILANRSIEMIVGIMGILKSGGAYLPIDPGYPPEWINYVLADSNVGILLTHKDITPSTSTLTSTLTCQVSPANLAYIIYTSGTTGKPKGVMVRHGSVVNTLVCRKEEYKMNGDDISMQLFPYVFDGFVTSFFTPIISGASVVLLSDEEIRDIEKIRTAIVKNKITHFICVPSLYFAVIDSLTPGETSTLKAVTLAGEKVSLSLLENTIAKNNNLEIVNEYGVTESAVMSTIYRHQEKDKTIKIGYPAWNTKIYILDRCNRVQPIGVPGELCIAGVGLARGYLNNPDLTAQKFCLRRPGGSFCKNRPLDPRKNFSLEGTRGLAPLLLLKVPGKRFYRSSRSYKSYVLYKTGDLARWLSDGNIEFFGRMDHQVKIRGFRIEIGEIETRLAAHPEIKKTVVIDRDNGKGDKYLCAYIVGIE
jgi:amino acid adenylation domain-containing protein